jgi:hypothetical protein
MRKWIGPFISLVLIMTLILISGPFSSDREMRSGGRGQREYRLQHVQNKERDGRGDELPDSHYVQVLKQLQEKLDEWLKSLNERIESEDITRLEVRFLEILRSVLEWIKEKIDAKIEYEDQQKKDNREKKGMFRETENRILPMRSHG